MNSRRKYSKFKRQAGKRIWLHPFGICRLSHWPRDIPATNFINHFPSKFRWGSVLTRRGFVFDVVAFDAKPFDVQRKIVTFMVMGLYCGITIGGGSARIAASFANSGLISFP